MNLSYWEYKSWFSDIDVTIIGSGIVGLNCAIRMRERFPAAKILVLEKGILPQGASTRNAGFACFGSVSELLTDLEKQSEEELFSLVQKRWEGIQILRAGLGDSALDYQCHGGHELFLQDKKESYLRCLDQMEALNSLLSPIFGKAPFEKHANRFGFGRVQELGITHVLEGQIDTGKMMLALLDKVRKNHIQIFNGLEVRNFEEQPGKVLICTPGFEFYSKHLLVATNGFASQLLREEVKPARAQVLITKPIKNLKIRGTFHLDKGYYYFRNIDNRILLGGGRNLDIKGETTIEFGQTPKIQEQLEWLLKEVILPGTPFEIERRWSGIMGLGGSKQPIVRQLSERVYCGVRLGGMGVAIGSLVGRELAELVQ